VCRLLAQIPIDPHRNRAGGGEVLDNARKQRILRQQATHKQPVRMPGLRRRGPVQRAIGQRVAVEHNNLLEPISQSPCGQPGDAGTDNNGCLADGRGARPTPVTL